MTRLCVHEFIVTDGDDPDLWAADIMYKWEQSEKGQWLSNHCRRQMIWERCLNHNIFGWQYRIVADLEGPALTEYLLRWS